MSTFPPTRTYRTRVAAGVLGEARRGDP